MPIMIRNSEVEDFHQQRANRPKNKTDPMVMVMPAISFHDSSIGLPSR